MENSKYLEKALDWARKKGFHNIKASVSLEGEDTETPSGFSKPGSDDEIQPDMTALKTGGKCYIEIATKSDNIRRTVTKWKLLSTIARMKGGRLFLLAPHGHKAFTNRLVKKHDIEARIISLS